MTNRAPATSVARRSEIQRRASLTDAIERLFRASPMVWISVTDLMATGGMLGWRSRVADARRRFKDAGVGDIEWNHDIHASHYRYLPYEPLGRDAGRLVSQRSLF